MSMRHASSQILREILPPLDKDRVLGGTQSPLFFGSAIADFGVDKFLDYFVDYGSLPAGRRAVVEGAEKEEEEEEDGVQGEREKERERRRLMRQRIVMLTIPCRGSPSRVPRVLRLHLQDAGKP